MLQCHQQMVYLLTDPACKFFFQSVNVFVAQNTGGVKNSFNVFVCYG